MPKRGRIPYEETVDIFLLLYLISDALKRIRFLGKTRLQKLVFLSEWEMLASRLKGFNYNFIKLIHGPFSSELERDMNLLAKHNMINDYGMHPAPQGLMILEDFSEIISRNTEYTEIIRSQNERYSRARLEELLDHIYALQHPYVRGYTIGNYSFTGKLLYRIPIEKARSIFRVTKEELKDLEICFDRDILKELEIVQREMKLGRFSSRQEALKAVET